jgi:hypothetical protein
MLRSRKRTRARTTGPESEAAASPARQNRTRYMQSAITDLFAGPGIRSRRQHRLVYAILRATRGQARRGRGPLGDPQACHAFHRAERGAGGRGPDHSRRRRARRTPRTPRRPADRARTDRDLLERSPSREGPRSGWKRDRACRAAGRLASRQRLDPEGGGIQKAPKYGPFVEEAHTGSGPPCKFGTFFWLVYAPVCAVSGSPRHVVPIYRRVRLRIIDLG